jgi:hypothetical protein
MRVAMFSCACSLRSTQCAALIALATAAGISRVESSPAPAGVDDARARAAMTQFAPRSETSLVFARWRASFESSGAPRFVVVTTQTVFDVSLVAELADSPAAIPCVRGILVPLFCAGPARVRASAQNRLPFAVGPPRHEIASNLRVVGTVVPGDFAARRSESDLPIATWENTHGPRLWRAAVPSRITAGTRFPSRSARRDGLVAPLRVRATPRLFSS